MLPAVPFSRSRWPSCDVEAEPKRGVAAPEGEDAMDEVVEVGIT